MSTQQSPRIGLSRTIHVRFHPCTLCTRFPLYRPTALVVTNTANSQYTSFSAQDAINYRPGLSRAARADDEFLNAIPTANSILTNPNIPIVGRNLAGTITNPDTSQTEGVPMRACAGGCKAAYMLPRDVWAAANRVGLGNQWTDEKVQEICLNAMANACVSLPVCKAEVFAFGECMVMIALKCEEVIDEEEKKMDFHDVADFLGT